MTKLFYSEPSVPLRQTSHGVCFSARFVRVISRLIFPLIIKEMCVRRARRTILNSEEGNVTQVIEPTQKNVSKEQFDGREWFSPTEVKRIYGFSRRTLGRILKEAEVDGRPVRVIRLTFRNGVPFSQSKRRPCVRINKEGLETYLDFCSRNGGEA